MNAGKQGSGSELDIPDRQTGRPGHCLMLNWQVRTNRHQSPGLCVMSVPVQLPLTGTLVTDNLPLGNRN